ncbi:MAG TPA: hypothetical protein VHH11_15420 [Gammaproteobacteria bacterium]|jgi:hypothetical protein|nr:hypothetical protein [Gammaproteobacteria bacterium]
MPGLRNETRKAAPAPLQQAPTKQDAHDEPQDPTTLRFSGPVTIADEDAGSDPYNRTGRFRRLVRD